MTTRLRDEFCQQQKENFDNATQVWLRWKKISEHAKYNPSSSNDVQILLPNGEYVTKRQLDIDMQQFADSYRTAKESKVILFDGDQVAVFLELIETKNFLPSIDYNLPFMDVWLNFSSPINIKAIDGDPTISALLVSQVTIDEKEYNENAKRVRQADEFFDAEMQFMPVDWSSTEAVAFNQVRTIYANLECDVTAWTSQSQYIMTLDDCDLDVMLWKEKARRLAAACIAYINCENIYLEKQGEVSEAVNRKREAKGKSRLEPYYVCRIKGVQHDSHETGTGAKHGIRYDVRGHFRRLETGKTIWVRPHQRGLQNELYIPKVYKVEKGSKPQWKANP